MYQVFPIPAVHPQLTFCVMEALLVTQFECSTNVQYKVTSDYCTLHYLLVGLDDCDLCLEGIGVYSCPTALVTGNKRDSVNSAFVVIMECLVGPSWMSGCSGARSDTYQVSLSKWCCWCVMFR